VGNEPVRSALLKTMLMSRFGECHTIDRTMEMTPATRRQKLKNVQTPIKRFETILLNECVVVESGER
jgi:hypothetical protein